MNAKRLARITRAPLLCCIAPLLAAATAYAEVFPLVTVDDPWAEATLYRDEWGVPHIYADTARGLGFAFGWAQAEDHLDDMLMAYRMANGRAAEVLGVALADSDAFALKMGHARLAREAFAAIDPFTRDICTGFSQGINAWMLQYPALVPEWADGVQPWDVLALWHCFLMSMAPFDLPDGYRRSRAFDTGNAWALAPHRTEEGKTILVINPHQYHDGPFRWHEAHLVLGPMDIAGAALMGIPLIIQGHNGFLGWAFTPNAPDSADFFEEQFASDNTKAAKDPRNPMAAAAQAAAAFTQEQWLMLQYFAESLPYYVRTPQGMREQRVPAVITARGPLFERGSQRIFSWRIGGYRDFGGLAQLHEMARARTLGAFQNALLMHQIPCFHVVYADREGNLFYCYNAKAGDRNMPEAAMREHMEKGANYLDWKRPAPASVESMTWATMIPPAALPHLVNPASGFIQACGTPPQGATDDPAFTTPDWPAWFAGDEDSYRARRARQLLRTGKRSFRDSHAMLFDVVAPAALDMVPVLLRMAEQRPDFVQASHPDLLTGLNVLRSWNAVADANAVGMSYYHLWWAMLAARSGFVQPRDSQLYTLMQSNTPMAQEIALYAAADAARWMRNEFQSLSVPWGDIHRIRRGERDEAMSGARTGEPIFLSGNLPHEPGRMRAAYGYGFAMAVQFSDPPEAVSLVPFGASNRPESPHHADQLPLMLEKRLKRTRYTHDAVWRYARRARGRRIALYPLGVEGAVTISAPQVFEARLNTSPDPPAPAPPEMAAFTLYVAPEYVPAAAPVRFLVELHVSETLCAEENLAQLALYAYQRGRGWFALPGQRTDPAQRRFIAETIPADAFAVLGPATLLRKTPPKNTVPRPAQEDAPSAAAPEEL